MKTIRFAVCGVGQRGAGLTKSIHVNLPDVEICAIFDPYEDRVDEICDAVFEKKGNRPKKYKSTAELFDIEKPDAVLVSTSWDAHVEISIEAMEKGIAVAMEVGGAYSEDEYRRLVEVYEKTKTPFMFMENCCFGKDELFAASMAKK